MHREYSYFQESSHKSNKIHIIQTWWQMLKNADCVCRGVVAYHVLIYFGILQNIMVEWKKLFVQKLVRIYLFYLQSNDGNKIQASQNHVLANHITFNTYKSFNNNWYSTFGYNKITTTSWTRAAVKTAIMKVIVRIRYNDHCSENTNIDSNNYNFINKR
jgi:hypothetical protein